MTPDFAWSWSPAAIVTIVSAGALYLRAWRATRAREGAGAASGWRLASFFAGLVVLAGALVSPLARLGEQLLVAHVGQHLLLFDFAPILLALAVTEGMLRPLEGAVRRFLNGPLGTAPAVLAIYAGSLALWHVPPLYDLALENDAVHFVQHAHLVLAGTLFWWRELAPESYRRTGGIGVLFYLAAGKFLTGLVASLLAFGPVLYDFYAEQPRVAGLSVAEDQQLGGLLMILVDSTLFITALAVLFYRALGESDREEPTTSAGAGANGAG